MNCGRDTVLPPQTLNSRMLHAAVQGAFLRAYMGRVRAAASSGSMHIGGSQELTFQKILLSSVSRPYRLVSVHGFFWPLHNFVSLLNGIIAEYLIIHIEMYREVVVHVGHASLRPIIADRTLLSCMLRNHITLDQSLVFVHCGKLLLNCCSSLPCPLRSSIPEELSQATWVKRPHLNGGGGAEREHLRGAASKRVLSESATKRHGQYGACTETKRYDLLPTWCWKR